MGSSSGATENFCLRWNDFESNVSVAFRDLREDEDFFDVTLLCDDHSGRSLQAHKVILSACSQLFKQMLRSCSATGQPNPMIYLRGVRLSDLESVLDFMYHGEVNVAQEDLNSFLAVAEDLQIKGLTQQPNHNSTPKEKSKVGSSSGVGGKKTLTLQNSGHPFIKRIKRDDDDVKPEPSRSAVEKKPSVVGPNSSTPRPVAVAKPGTGSSSNKSVSPTPVVVTPKVNFDDESSHQSSQEGPSGFGDETFDDDDEFANYGDGDGNDGSLLEPEISGIADDSDTTKGKIDIWKLIKFCLLITVNNLSVNGKVLILKCSQLYQKNTEKILIFVSLVSLICTIFRFGCSDLCNDVIVSTSRSFRINDHDLLLHCLWSFLY